MASRPARATSDRPSSATHSGKLLLRMPPALHARLAEEAERERVSLNQLITKRLEESLRRPSTGAAEAEDTVEGEAGSPGDRRRRLTTVVLAVNFAVVLLAAAVAIVLLVVALGDLS